MLKTPLKSNVVENIKDELQKIELPHEIIAVYLYGSIVKGKLRLESDIDVAILPDYKVDQMQALKLISKVESIFTKIFRKFGILNEISVLNMRGKFVSIELLFDIQMNGVCIYEKSIEQHLEFKNFISREYFSFKPFLEKLRAQKYELYLKKIEIITESLKKLKEINTEIKNFKDYKASWRYKDIAERNLHKIIEAIIDLGKITISIKKLKEPATNREVFEILNEQNLLPSEFLDIIDKMIGLRNIIVHSYDRIDDTVIYGILKKNLKDIEKIKAYFVDLLK